jgi:EF-P beta-lysylation protein EpmB
VTISTLNPLWRQIQRQNFTRLEPLALFLELNPDDLERLVRRPRFPLNLPLRLAQKIKKGTLDDPIFRQFIPLVEETRDQETFSKDPVGDLPARRASRLLHKYHGRALLLVTSACPMHCRFCFRQNFPYEDNSSDFSEELRILAGDPTINEVILSGGDPLSLSDESLRELLGLLSAIPHIQRIRFHTRFPIGIPERLDQAFLDLLAIQPKQLIFVIHTNHPLELDDEVKGALSKLHRLGIPILNHSVLLRGVNDDEETLLALSQALTNTGIMPYYLNLLDRVSGSAHFEVSLERGQELIAYLQTHLSGYGVPKLVREEAGKPSKVSH